PKRCLVGYATTVMKSNGPSHAVGHKSSKKHDRYSLERNQCLCAAGKRVGGTYRNQKPKSLDTADSR
ncbi:MAG: hypothetical protein WAL60_22845, partial [Candidatus Sulfotelmatobacter sp.]